MSNLSKYLVEQILLDENSNSIKKTVVVYSGRFQPFHSGHYKTYQLLVKKFGKDDVYIGTTNVVEKGKSPFNFKEKVEIMTTMFGIPKSHIIQVKQPYKPVEILSKFDENSTAFITVVGEKDENRLGGKYFRKYTGEPTEPYRDAGYVFISPTQPNPISGTAVRNGMSTGTEKEKQDFFKNVVYPKFNQKIFNLISGKLHESFEIEKETIEEWLVSAKDWIITEGSATAGALSDDGPLGFFPNMDVFSKISVDRAKQIGYDILDMIMTRDVEDFYVHPEYPFGPVKAVSFFPAGVLGHMTPNNQIDIYSSGAYTDWYKHVTRMASLAGFQIVATQMQRDEDNLDKKLSVATAKAAKHLDSGNWNKQIQESITLPVEVGDTLLMGKFKNHPVVVKTIGKDDHGMPTINGKKVVTFRFGKKGPNIFDNVVEFEDDSINEEEGDKYTHIGFGRYKLKGKEKDSSSPVFTKDDNGHFKSNSTKKLGAKPKEPKPENGSIFKTKPSVEKSFNKTKTKVANQYTELITKVKDWSAEEKKFIEQELHDGQSDVKYTLSQKIRHKLKGAIIYVKKEYNKEVDEFKTAGQAANDFVHGKKLTKHEIDALKGVAKTVIITALFAGSTGGLAHGAVAFGQHVAMELVPHVVAETLLKGIGKAALFAGAEDEERGLELFIQKVAENLETFKITPEMMNNIADSYNNSKKTESININEDLTTGFKNLGIARNMMPQIESKYMKKYLDYIKGQGYLYKIKAMPISKLNLTQGEINKDKVEQLMTTSRAHLAKPVIVSSGGYILDGHHRVLALYALDNNAKIPVIQINCEIGKLLKISRNWNDVSFKHIHESILIAEAANKLKIAIPASVQKINNAFKKHGKKLYIVGGAVRDAILGKIPHDFDLTTDAKPHEIVSICDKEGLKHVDTDIIYGMVVVNGDEVVTFRKDIGGNRKLDGIDYTDIAGDVRRRDLTINALFYDIERKEIVDLVGGIKDLQDKRIRTVGVAADRFEEDHLRKLRAVRFTVKLGGIMDPDTLLAIKKDPTLKDVSDNRIRMEFMKSVESAKSTKIYLDLMEKLKFLPLTFPGLKITKPYIDENDYIVLMAYLLNKNSKSTLETKLNSLKYENPEIIDITFLQSLDKFKPEEIVEYKKQQKRTKLSDAQILAYGKHTNKDYSKFVKFNASVKGGDAPKDVKGKAVGDWIASEEKKKFLNEVWRPKDYINFIVNNDLPISEPIMKKIIGEQVVTTIHVTDLPGYKQLKKMEGKSKSLATFKSAYENSQILRAGLLTGGGLYVILQGNLLLKSYTDIHSDNDKNGRRWLYFDKIFDRIESNITRQDYLAFLHKDKEYIDAYTQYMDLDRIDATGKKRERLIKRYIELAYEFMLKHKDEIKKQFSDNIKNPPTSRWDELIINKIKILDVIAYNQYGPENIPQEVKEFFGKDLKIAKTKGELIKFIKKNGGNILTEMAKPELKSVEVVADKMLSPIDVEFTKHFFSRVNNERNVKEITPSELIGFFRRLYKHKKEFIEFLKQYRQVVVKDNKSKINIPFVQDANKLIAKTVMRTADWHKSSTPEFQFESNTPTSAQFKSGLVELRNAIEKGTHGLDKSDAIKLLYQNAMKMGISNKLIDNKTRLALNRHNKNFSSLNTPTKDTAIQGIDLVLKTLAENINEEQLNELAWESNTVDMCIAGQLPMTSKLMNQIFGKVQINTLHITDPYGLDKLAKLQGTKKSLSTFTAASTQSNIAVGMGIRTSGGVIVAMKGDLLVASVDDIMSRPDPQGRRWVSPYFLWGYWESSSTPNGFPTVIANNKKLSDFAEKYGAIDKWQGDFHRIDQGKLKVTNNEINDFIRLYMKEAEKFALAHKDEIIKHNVGLQNRAPGGWNEVLVNNIKIEEIMVMDWKVDERATDQIKKKYKNVTIGYDTRDIPKFVNKYGKFITENTISNKQPLSELDFNPHLAKKTKVWYNFSPSDIMKVSDNVIDLVQTAYSKTTDGSFINSKSDINRSDFWTAITLDNEPDADAVIFGRNTKQGIKLQGIGHDGKEISKSEVVKHLGRQLKKQGFWVEASEALERVLYKVGIPYVSSEKVAQSIFPNSDLKMTGNKGQYTRKLENGKVITETIFGKPKVSVKEDIDTTLNEAPAGSGTDLAYLIRHDYFPIFPSIMEKIIGKTTVLGIHSTDVWNYQNVEKLEGTKKTISTFTNLTADSPMMQLQGLRTQGGVFVAIKGTLLLRSIRDLWSNIDIQGRKWVPFDEFFPKGSSYATELGKLQMMNPIYKKYHLKLRDESTFTNAELGELTKAYIDIMYGFMIKHKTVIHDKFTGKLNDLEGKWNELLIGDIRIVDTLVVLKPGVTDIDVFKRKIDNDVKITHDVNDLKKFINKYGGAITENINEVKQPHKITIFDVAEKHQMNPDDLKFELQKGFKVEREHGNTTKVAEENAINNLFTDTNFYSNLSKGNINEAKERPTITFLVGPPASGKSTWVSKHGNGKVIISRDDIAERVAKSHNISYNDLFDGTHEDLQKSIDTELDAKLMASLKSRKDIIVDMTNVSKKIRNGILSRVSKKVYTRNAVVFNVSKGELLKRLQQREKETGKRISPEVLDDMMARFEKPTHDEFDNITNESINEEIKDYPVNNQIKTFKDLFSKLPAELQKRIFGLKSISQNPKWHPEGNVLKHTIMVVNRALKTAPGDIDLALAAMFHDIGKDETSGIHPKTGQVTHYGHEFTSAQLVKKYADVIKSLGGNVEDVFYIVNNHMRMKNYDIMRISKQRELNSHQSFGKLQHFSSKMDKGGLKDNVNEAVQWEDEVLGMIRKQYVPVTDSIITKILGNTEVKTFHITDPAHLPNLIAMVGKKKALSTFNGAHGDSTPLATGDGMWTDGGVLVLLSGKLLASSWDDLWSRPDKQGRRWINPINVFNTDFKIVNSNPRLKDLYTRINVNDKLSQEEKQEFIKTYISDSYKAMYKYKDEFIQNIKNRTGKVNGRHDWNEVIINNIKINGLLIYMPMVSKKQAADIEKKYKKYNIEYADDKMELRHYFKKNGGIIENTITNEVDSIDKLVNDMDTQLESFVFQDKNKEVLNEGGAYGHMHHPFDTEINLTFGQLKDIVSRALDGNLEVTKEKTDGQALAISWKNGKLIAARNKGHLKNQGEKALDIKGISDKFQNRGGLTDAYNYAMSDLSKAIGSLSQKQRDKIFQNGSSFMNLEVIWPDSVNVIPYGQPLLVFHSSMQYNLDGVAIGQDVEAAKILAGMIKQVNQDTQSNYVIQGPPVIELPKSQNLSSKKSGYLAKISKLQKEFGLKDSAGVAEYHQAWWDTYITKNSPSKLDKEAQIGLIKRWAFYEKGFKLNSNTIKDEKTLAWAQKIDNEDQKKISKDNLMKFEDIFLGVGADVLEFTKSVLTVNPDEAIRKMKDRISQTIKDVQKSNDPKKIDKLKLELKRLNAIGGIDRIVPSEGIVFTYNGHVMKLTGSFASVNQLLGIFFE